MMDYSLSAKELAELRAAHPATRDKWEADRVKAVILLESGWSSEDIADALLISPQHRALSRQVRQFCSRVRKCDLTPTGEDR